MKNLLFVPLLMLAFLPSCYKEGIDPEMIKSLKAELNKDKNENALIANADFNKHMDMDDPKKSYGWNKWAYPGDGGPVFRWGKKIGRNETGGISMESPTGRAYDMALIMDVFLDPMKFYRFSAWIKTENVHGGEGANICLYGSWIRSRSLLGTSGWQKITLDLPLYSDYVKLGLRLGYWSALSNGKAYFDDVSIEELDKFIATSQHIRLVLDGDDAAVVSNQTITSWLANLDKAYSKYYELVGGYPYGGGEIMILSTDTYPGGWAVAGNPILWYKPYIREELQSIASTGTWSFGIMHELAHDFVLKSANKNWIINEEMFANFRMFYVVDQLNARIFQGGKLYIGAALENYYKTDASQSYANTIGRGILAGHDGLMYTLIRIKNNTGWDPIVKAIRDLNASSVSTGTRTQMFYLFLDKISQYAGQNVRNTYPPGELLAIEQLLK